MTTYIPKVTEVFVHTKQPSQTLAAASSVAALDKFNPRTSNVRILTSDGGAMNLESDPNARHTRTFYC